MSHARSDGYRFRGLSRTKHNTVFSVVHQDAVGVGEMSVGSRETQTDERFIALEHTFAEMRKRSRQGDERQFVVLESIVTYRQQTLVEIHRVKL